MNAGIIMSFLNQRYFRDSLSTYCEFIPQMLFLNGLFGYLCLLIVGKWVSGSTADLYHVMIYMFLSPGSGGLMCAGTMSPPIILPLGSCWRAVSAHIAHMAGIMQLSSPCVQAAACILAGSIICSHYMWECPHWSSWVVGSVTAAGCNAILPASR